MKTELKSLWHSSHTIAFICVYLRTEFQGSSIILMSFRKGVILPPPLPTTAKHTPQKSTQIRIKRYRSQRKNFSQII